MSRTERSNISNSDLVEAGDNQKGSILIGLIITMVIMAALGAGMVYLTTTSTYNELFANNHARAYYAAESGGRYALSRIREAYAQTTTTARDDILATVPGTYYMGTASNNAGNFVISALGGNITGNPAHVTFTSTGTVASGFLQAKRQISYRIDPANQQGGNTQKAPEALPRAASDFNVPKQDLDIYYSPVDLNEVDIKSNPTVDGDNALNLKSECYTMGLRWYDNTSTMAQLDTLRSAHGGLLSYTTQAKIFVNDNSSLYNIIGITFRLDDSSGTSIVTDNMYGISFVKMPNPKPATNDKEYKKAPDWYKNLIYTNSAWDVFSTGAAAGKWFIVLWKRTGVTSGNGCGTGTYAPLAYKALTSSDWWACNPGDGDSTSCTVLRSWATLYINVVEVKASSSDPYGYTQNTLYNEMKSYLPAYTRSTNANPLSILWDNTNLIAWTTVTGTAIAKPGASPAKSIVADGSLSTKNYDYYTSNPKAREIGLHIFNNSTSAQNIFYDNFYIDLTPSMSGGTDGSGDVIQGP